MVSFHISLTRVVLPSGIQDAHCKVEPLYTLQRFSFSSFENRFRDACLCTVFISSGFLHIYSNRSKHRSPECVLQNQCTSFLTIYSSARFTGVHHMLLLRLHQQVRKRKPTRKASQTQVPPRCTKCSSNGCNR